MTATTRTAATTLATTALAGALALGGAMAPAHAAGTPEHPYTDGTGTLETPHFRVSLTDIQDYNHADTILSVEVCATNVAPGQTVRVSRDPWSFHQVGEDAQKPWRDSTFPAGLNGPAEVQLAQGECASGDLHVKQHSQRTAVQYANGYGETATFRFDS